MFVKNILFAVTAALFTTQAMGAVLIATNADAACRCPNNCSYTVGHSCKFYSGPSDQSKVVSGHCQSGVGGLTCVV